MKIKTLQVNPSEHVIVLVLADVSGEDMKEIANIGDGVVSIKIDSRFACHACNETLPLAQKSTDKLMATDAEGAVKRSSPWADFCQTCMQGIQAEIDAIYCEYLGTDKQIDPQRMAKLRSKCPSIIDRAMDSVLADNLAEFRAYSRDAAIDMHQRTVQNARKCIRDIKKEHDL